MKVISKNIVPRGFKFAGIHCGIKRKKKDLGLIYSDTPAVAAGLWTTNKMQAAPIQICKKNIENKIQAIIVSSGKEESDDFAEAILTTDKVSKQVALELKIGGKEVIISGVAKGSGMISPKMATMLCFVTTDIDIDKALLKDCLKEAAENSFNQITIDGEMSTNDTVLCLANGRAGNDTLHANKREKKNLREFQEALNYVTAYLAKEIVKDGEGATKLIEIEVQGAKKEVDAEKVARRIANSNLIKAMFYGESTNYGRIAAAIGATGVDLKNVDIHLVGNKSKIKIFKQGYFINVDEGLLKKILEEKEIKLKVDLNKGNFSEELLTCDLSEEYVRINK